MPEKTLLEQISETPDVIAEFSREQLEEAKSALIEYGKTLMSGLDESDDKRADLDAAKEAKERLEVVKERLAEFAAEDEAIDAEASEIAESFDEPEPEEPEAEEEKAPEAEATEVEEAPETPVVEEEQEAIAASDKPSVGAIAKRAPKPPVPKPALVASAGEGVGVREFTDASQLIETFARMGDKLKGERPASPTRHLIASFGLETRPYKYEANGDELHDAQVIGKLLSELEHGKDALVATGGICAPAQPVYDFFSISQEAGLVELPTVAAPRGRLTYPVSASYATVRDTANWSAAAGQQHTNAADEAGTSKNTFQVTCPSTTTCTVDAYPVILQFGNFQQRFYPEFIAHSIAESMRFHSHFVNASLIADMVTASTAQGAGDTGGGGLVNVANLVGFEAMKYRDNFRMSPEAILELVLPAWVLDALVADLVARNATTSFENARARVRAVFASLNLRVQAVQDWQSPADAADGGWRTAADMLLFAPGTFVRLDGGALNLGIVRDSTLNATNDFQTFTETFEAICEVGHDSWLLDDVTICPRGIAAADATLDCNPGFGS